MNLYPCPTNVIVTFHSLSVFEATIGGYLNIILIISAHTFFFSKKIAYSLSMSVFMANALNSIIKSAMFFFPCLKISILYSASAILLLLLNVILISHINSS